MPTPFLPPGKIPTGGLHHLVGASRFSEVTFVILYRAQPLEPDDLHQRLMIHALRAVHLPVARSSARGYTEREEDREKRS